MRSKANRAVLGGLVPDSTRNALERKLGGNQSKCSVMAEGGGIEPRGFAPPTGFKPALPLSAAPSMCLSTLRRLRLVTEATRCALSDERLEICPVDVMSEFKLEPSSGYIGV